MEKNLFIFFTENIKPENKNTLSYGAKKIGELENENVYFNSINNLVFYYSYNHTNRYKSRFKLFSDIYDLLKDKLKEKLNDIFVFYHGSEFGSQTEFKEIYSVELIKELQRITENNHQIYAFDFSHSGDAVDSLLSNYKKTLHFFGLSGKTDISKDNLNDIITTYFRLLTPKNDFSDSIKALISKNNKIQEKGKDFYIFILRGLDGLEALYKKNFTAFIKALNFKDKNIKPIIFVIEKEVWEHPLISKQKNFLDSSIWFRTIILDKITDKLEEKILNLDFDIPELTPLNKLIAIIESDINDRIYYTQIAREYRDFILQTAQIKLIDTGAHSDKISPFYFHSETKMQEQAKKSFEHIKNYKWNFLFIDDFADRPLRAISDNLKGKKTKEKIIRDTIDEQIIEEFTSTLCISKEDLKNQEDVKNFNCAKDLIKKGRFDIILLDYLFSNEDVYGKKKQIYGDKFFELIKERQIKENLSINNKYWIFPVSVFNSALNSKLQERGFDFNEQEWIYSPGADPINTPNLFKYKLYRFLELQLKALPTSPFEIFQLLIEEKLTDKLEEYAYKLLPKLMNRFSYIFIMHERILQIRSGILKSVYKTYMSKETNNLNFSIFDVAKTFRDFLNFCSNPGYQAYNLFISFVKLYDYWDLTKQYCKKNLENYEKKVRAIDEIFKLLNDKIITF